MCRCRCCDELLDHIDLRLLKGDNSPEDLCRECRSWAEKCIDGTIDEMDDHEYVLGNVTEGVRETVFDEYYEESE